MLVYTKASMQEPGRFRVHETTFVLDGSALLVVDARDYSVSDSGPRFPQLEQGQDLCDFPTKG